MTSQAPSTLSDSQSVVVLPCVAGLADLSDGELLELQRQSGAARRQVDAVVAAISGEVARRSDRALGHSGLAARTGAATPEKAVQALTGVSHSEARALVAAGAALGGGSPWLTPVADALEAGDLTVAAAAAISSGLGTPSADVAADDLLDAASSRVDFATQSTPELTMKAARQAREHLDVEHIADLEEHRRSRRNLRWSVLPNGNVRLVGELDPESAGVVVGAVETLLAPRRGGPRFVDPLDAARANALATDPRTNDQLAVDALVEIVQLAVRASGSDVDAQQLFGTRSPAVRVHVQASDLKNGEGFAYIEGQGAFVSLATAKRIGCEAGWLPVVFDGDRAIDTGRTQRLHTPAQRVAIAAQWNGCPVGSCDRPPSMTEVHHVESWDGSNTTLHNGISLCRFHHMELHANHWAITKRDDGALWFVPPPGSIADALPISSRSPFAETSGLARTSALAPPSVPHVRA